MPFAAITYSIFFRHVPYLGCGHGYCLVNGKKAPYVGNICMDVCMIDVTDIDCREGDQAIIFGDELPITVLSDALETIPYEVLTGISTRVKRVYYQEYNQQDDNPFGTTGHES